MRSSLDFSPDVALSAVRGNELTMVLGPPTATGGDLDKAIIRRYIKRNALKLQACYEHELAVAPTLQGQVTATFTIGADGVVTGSTALGMTNDHVTACVAKVISAIEFPMPRDRKAVHVTYPLRFHAPHKESP